MRLDELVSIGINEISCRGVYKFVVVVMNHGCRGGRSKSVHEWSYKSILAEQFSRVRTVAEDLSCWVTDCAYKFTFTCERYVKLFHVLEWAMGALDEVRRNHWRPPWAGRTVRCRCVLCKWQPQGEQREYRKYGRSGGARWARASSACWAMRIECVLSAIRLVSPMTASCSQPQTIDAKPA